MAGEVKDGTATKPYTMLVVTSSGSWQEFLADRLSLTDGGGVRLFINGQLVGAFKSDAWARIMVVPGTKRGDK